MRSVIGWRMGAPPELCPGPASVRSSESHCREGATKVEGEGERALDRDHCLFFAPTHVPLTSPFRNTLAPKEAPTDTLSGGLTHPRASPSQPLRLRLHSHRPHAALDALSSPWTLTVPAARPTKFLRHSSPSSPSPVTVLQLPVYRAVAS